MTTGRLVENCGISARGLKHRGSVRDRASEEPEPHQPPRLALAPHASGRNHRLHDEKTASAAKKRPSENPYAGDRLVGLELLGGNEAFDGVMLSARLQILADGEEIDVGGAQVVHHLQDLVPFLAEAEHDA